MRSRPLEASSADGENAAEMDERMSRAVCMLMLAGGAGGALRLSSQELGYKNYAIFPTISVRCRQNRLRR